MANSLLTSLTELTSPASGDTFYIVDVSDTSDDATGTNKKITYSNLTSGFAASGANSDITSLTGLTTPLSVAQGGSGAATLTGILKGSGTSAFTAVTAPSGALVGTTDTQTLSGKTLTAFGVVGDNGTLKFLSDTDGGDFNIYHEETGAKTLALYGSSSNTLNVSLLDGTLKIISPGNATTDALTTDATQTLTNKTLTAPKFADAGFIADAAGNELLVFSQVSTAVNYITIENDAAGGSPEIRAEGSDTDIDLILSGQGTGVVKVNSGDPAATTTGTETLTNKRVTKRVTTITSHATPTVNTDDCDAVTITALATNITSMTTNLSGTPTNFQPLIYRILDDGTARTITWGASFQAMGVALPTTTTISKVLTVGFLYDTVDSKWGCVFVSEEA